MNRICPKCHENLGLFSYFFCYKCGTLLPVELHIIPNLTRKSFIESDTSANLEKVKSKNFPIDFKLKKIDKKLVYWSILGLLFILIISLAFAINPSMSFIKFKTYSNKELLSEEQKNVPQSSESVSLTKEPEYKNSVNMTFDYKSAKFGANSPEYYVPHDVDFYMEFNDISLLNELFAGLPAYKEINISSNALFKDNFGVFIKKMGSKYVWSFVLFPLDYGQNIDLESVKNIYYQSVESAFILTADESIINSVENSKKALSKGLNLNSKFVVGKSTASPEGKAFLLSLSDQGKSLFKDISVNSDFSQDLRDLFKTFTDSGLDYMVIL